MKVSVIIPAWRAERFIAGAIASARAQTLENIEIIVIDDCSPDDTPAASERAAGGDDRVRIVRLPTNGGPSAARNRGIDLAQGEWLAVLDADDTMEPSRLERLVAFAEREKLDIAADDLRLIEQGAPGGGRAHLGIGEIQRVDLATYASGNRIFSSKPLTGYLKPLFRSAFLKERAVRYDPLVRIGEDYVIVATALALGAAYAVMPEALYNYSVRNGSLSRTLTAADLASLIAADDRFMARFGSDMAPRARAAVLARRARLDDAGAFLAAVDALRAGDGVKAASAMAQRPACVRHFAIPIVARLARAVGVRRGAPL